MSQPPQFQKPLALNKLKSHLQETINILRDGPVDYTGWINYILPLLFFKCICDVWDEEYQEMIELYGEDFVEGHRFHIPKGCHWRDMRQTPTNVGAALQNALRCIEAANQSHLYSIFGDTWWINRERLPDALLKELIEHFSALSLCHKRVKRDDIYATCGDLTKQFADATNREADELYTPRSVVQLIVNILDPQEGETIYDPACGAGGMLLEAAQYAREAGGDPRTFFGKLYGQEKNLTTARLARVNLLLHGIEDFAIEPEDTLRNPVRRRPDKI